MFSCSVFKIGYITWLYSLKSMLTHCSSSLSTALRGSLEQTVQDILEVVERQGGESTPCTPVSTLLASQGPPTVLQLGGRESKCNMSIQNIILLHPSLSSRR